MKYTCPECEKVTVFNKVPDERNSDLLGRTQYACSGCLANCILNDDEMLFVSGQEWDNNLLQFARILSELRAFGLGGEGVWDELIEQTGLSSEQLNDLFERAQFVWEQAKEIKFHPEKAEWYKRARSSSDKEGKIRWVVEDKTGDNEIVLPHLPFSVGPRLAQVIALTLNTEPKTMLTDPILTKEKS
jgi:hypothetical protein